MSFGLVCGQKKPPEGGFFLAPELTCWPLQRVKRQLLQQLPWRQPWLRRRLVRWQPQERVQRPVPVLVQGLALLFCHKRQGLRLRSGLPKRGTCSFDITFSVN